MDNIKGWVSLLKHWDRIGRRGAAWKIGRIAEANPGNPELLIAIGPLIKGFADPDVLMGRDCAEALAKIGESAIPALIQEMDNKNTRFYAIKALGEIGGEKVVPAVGKMIEVFEDRMERMCASNALVSIGKPAIPALVSALKHDNEEIRKSAAFAIGLIAENHRGDREVLEVAPYLIDTLEDKSPKARWGAISALGRFGDVRFVLPLARMLMDEANGKLANHVLKNILENCDGIGAILEFKRRLKESVMAASRHADEIRLAEARMNIAKLLISAEDRINQLSHDKGILLDDRPEPPKRRKVYQRMRRQTNER